MTIKQLRFTSASPRTRYVCGNPDGKDYKTKIVRIVGDVVR